MESPLPSPGRSSSSCRAVCIGILAGPVSERESGTGSAHRTVGVAGSAGPPAAASSMHAATCLEVMCWPNSFGPERTMSWSSARGYAPRSQRAPQSGRGPQDHISVESNRPRAFAVAMLRASVSRSAVTPPCRSMQRVKSGIPRWLAARTDAACIVSIVHDHRNPLVIVRPRQRQHL